MRKDLKWRTSYGSIDIKVINDFENKIGFKFPKSYKEIVSEFDSASIDNHMSSFKYYSNFENEFTLGDIGRFFCFRVPKDKFDKVESMAHKWSWTQKESDYPFPKNVVPFSRDGAGNYICFDYRKDPKTNNPSILFWFHEAESGSKEELSFVANSFDELLDMLFDDRTEDEKKEYEEFMKFSILD